MVFGTSTLRNCWQLSLWIKQIDKSLNMFIINVCQRLHICTRALMSPVNEFVAPTYNFGFGPTFEKICKNVQYDLIRHFLSWSASKILWWNGPPFTAACGPCLAPVLWGCSSFWWRYFTQISFYHLSHPSETTSSYINYSLLRPSVSLSW